jgi:hypothetical protein
MNDELWKDVLEGRKKVKELGVQLVHMERQNAKPSEKLQIVNNFLRNAAQKRPATTVPPMTTPTGSKAACSETPGTHASGASVLTNFLAEPPREVRVPTPIKKTKASAESLEGAAKASAESSEGIGFCDAIASGESTEGFGLCAAGHHLCSMPYRALNHGCFGPSGKPMHRCTECKGIIHYGLCATGEGSDLVCKLCDQ